MAKKSSFVSLVILALICAAGYFGWQYFSQPAAPAQQRAGQMMGGAPPVRVADVRVQNVPHFLNGLGTVQPSAEVVVRSRVDGQLTAIHFKEGQRVEAGDLLAEVDPRPFQATLDQARARLEEDKAQLWNAERDLERYGKLIKGDYIAQQQYQAQQALVRQRRAAVQADEAQVASASLQLEYSRITAPMSGRLGLRNVDPGNQIRSGDTAGIVRLSETQPCDVIFTLPETQAPLVAAALRHVHADPDAKPLMVQAWDRGDKELLSVGELLSLDNQIDQATGTVKLKARFPNQDDTLFSRQFVNVRLLVQTIPDALTVPTAAVQLGARGSYCYLLFQKDGRDFVEYREITPGLRIGEVTVIDAGLAGGDMVVVDGIDRLRNDSPVRVAATMETPEVTLDEPPAMEAAQASTDVAS